MVLTIDQRRAAYHAFDPGPLPTERSDLYIDFSAARGDERNPAECIYERLLLSYQPEDPGAFCRQLLTGHQGSGKSSELLRLMAMLTKVGNPRLLPILCDLEKELDPNDVDLPDVLLVMIKQVALRLQEGDLGQHLQLDQPKLSILEKLYDLIGLRLDKVELHVGLAKVTASVRAGDAARDVVRNHLNLQMTSLLDVVNEVFDRARSLVTTGGFDDFIVIVDNGDKLQRRQNEAAPGESLFLERSSPLLSLNCHWVMTTPFALVHSYRGRELETRYGEVQVVPLVKVQQRDGNPFTLGINLLKQMVDRRLRHAAVPDLLKPDVLELLVRSSGGQPRELCQLIRSVIERSRDATATLATVDSVLQQKSRLFSSWLQKPHWRLIEALRSGQQILPDQENRDPLRDLVAGRAVLHYRNADEWLGVNPLVGPTPPGLDSDPPGA